MKSKKVLLLVVMAISLLICACSDPRSTVIPQDIETWETNKKFSNSVDKISDDDKKLLLAYAMRKAFSGEEIEEGITIGEAIDSEKKIQEEN